MPHPTVMLVGSVQDDHEMYGAYLRGAAFAVIEVDHIAEALACATAVDVVVTDIRVRGFSDGLGLVRQLRRDNATKGIPIIVLTACAFESDRQAAERAGCDGFLAKPCLPDALLTEIRRVLARRLSRRLPSRTSIRPKRHAS